MKGITKLSLIVVCVFVVSLLAYNVLATPWWTEPVDFYLNETAHFDSVKVNTTTITNRYNQSANTLEIDFPYAEKDANLISYWRFSDSASYTDETGFSTITTPTAPDFTESGKFGGGYDFESDNDDYLNTNKYYDYTTVTLSAWVKAESLGSSSFGNIFGKYESASDQFLFRTHTSNYFQLAMVDGGSTKYLIGGGGPVRLGSWYHVVAVMGTGGAKLYVNGTLIGSSADTTSLGAVKVSLLIGAINNVTASNEFDGIIDEPKIYNRALTQTEITSLYNNQKQYIDSNWASSQSNWTSATQTITADNKLKNVTINMTTLDTKYNITAVHFLNSTGDIKATNLTDITTTGLVTYSTAKGLNTGSFDYLNDTEDLKIQVFMQSNGVGTPIIYDITGYYESTGGGTPPVYDFDLNDTYSLDNTTGGAIKNNIYIKDNEIGLGIFDDFNGTVIDSKWNNTGDIVLDGLGNLSLRRKTSSYYMYWYQDPVSIGARQTVRSISNHTIGYYAYHNSLWAENVISNDDYISFSYTFGSNTMRSQTRKDLVTSSAVDYTMNIKDWQETTVNWTSTAITFSNSTDVLGIESNTSLIPTDSLRPYFKQNTLNSVDVLVDWIWVYGGYAKGNYTTPKIIIPEGYKLDNFVIDYNNLSQTSNISKVEFYGASGLVAYNDSVLTSGSSVTYTSSDQTFGSFDNATGHTYVKIYLEGNLTDTPKITRIYGNYTSTPLATSFYQCYFSDGAGVNLTDGIIIAPIEDLRCNDTSALVEGNILNYGNLTYSNFKHEFGLTSDGQYGITSYPSSNFNIVNQSNITVNLTRSTSLPYPVFRFNMKIDNSTFNMSDSYMSFYGTSDNANQRGLETIDSSNINIINNTFQYYNMPFDIYEGLNINVSFNNFYGSGYAESGYQTMSRGTGLDFTAVNHSVFHDNYIDYSRSCQIDTYNSYHMSVYNNEVRSGTNTVVFISGNNYKDSRRGSAYMEIYNNTGISNGYGIDLLEGINHSRVYNNTLIGVGYPGIIAHGSSTELQINITIENNTLSESSTIVTLYVEDSVIRNNVLYDITRDGIKIWVSNNINVTNNTIIDGDLSYSSIEILESNNTLVLDNNINGINSKGIYDNGAINSTIENNTIGGTVMGISSWSSETATIKNNTIEASANMNLWTYYESGTGSTGNFDVLTGELTLTQISDGVSWNEYESNHMLVGDFDIQVDFSDMDYTSVYDVYPGLMISSTSAPLFDSDYIAISWAMEGVGQDKNYTAWDSLAIWTQTPTADVSGKLRITRTISGTDVTINWYYYNAGWQLLETNIYDTTDPAQLWVGNDMYTGVVNLNYDPVGESFKIVFDGFTINDNHEVITPTTNYGISMDTSNYNEIINNTIINSIINGMHLITSNNNSFIENNFNQTTQFDIYLIGSESNLIENNSFLEGTDNSANIYLEATSPFNNITNNTGYNADAMGEFINVNSDSNIISNNTIMQSWIGVYGVAGSNNIITRNTFNGNSEIAIDMSSGSGNTISYNVMNNMLDACIYLPSETNDIVEYNNCSYAPNEGIMMQTSDSMTIRFNNINHTGTAIYNEEGNLNQFINNTIYNGTIYESLNMLTTDLNTIYNMTSNVTYFSGIENNIEIRELYNSNVPANTTGLLKLDYSYLNITNGSTNAWIDLNLTYDESQANNESDIKMHKYSTNWVELPSVLYPLGNYVNYNITSFSEFALFDTRTLVVSSPLNTTYLNYTYNPYINIIYNSSGSVDYYNISLLFENNSQYQFIANNSLNTNYSWYTTIPDGSYIINVTMCSGGLCISNYSSIFSIISATPVAGEINILHNNIFEQISNKTLMISHILSDTVGNQFLSLSSNCSYQMFYQNGTSLLNDTLIVDSYGIFRDSIDLSSYDTGIYSTNYTCQFSSISSNKIETFELLDKYTISSYDANKIHESIGNEYNIAIGIIFISIGIVFLYSIYATRNVSFKKYKVSN